MIEPAATLPQVAVTREGLAAAIRKARQTAGLEQTDLADRLRTSTTTISDLERGVRPLTVERLSEIAEATGQSACRILADAGEQTALDMPIRDAIASDPALKPHQRQIVLDVYLEFTGPG